MKKNITVLLFCILITSLSVISQNSNIFIAQTIQKAYKNNTRSNTGQPGTNYWQNSADYNIIAEFIPETYQLLGYENIIYYNNSPDTLKYLVIKLKQNLYKKGAPRDYDFADALTDGVNIKLVKINNTEYDINSHSQIIVSGTNMYVILPRTEKILPKSETNISIEWDFTFGGEGMRSGTFTDSAFFVAYWYPQIAVYDDIWGWDTENYLGTVETYQDLANFSVEITVPNNYFIWATGEMQNESEIYSDLILNRITESRNSKTPISIISTNDYNNNINLLKGASKNIWKFDAPNVPDFAFALSNYYLWDAATITTGTNTKTWVSTVYPAETIHFEKTIDIALKSIEYFSKTFPGIPFPYPKHTTVNCKSEEAMEYPMMANNSDVPEYNLTVDFTAHEIAHTYLPFYVLANEKQYAWMDEGWVNLCGEKVVENIYNFDLTELGGIQNSFSILSHHSSDIFNLPLMTPSSSLNTNNAFAQTYTKSVIAHRYLLEIMEEKDIDNPLKIFLETWKDKHPSAYDFFFLMNNIAHEDLSWFWNPWYFEFACPDLAIKEVANNTITIENVGGLPSPIALFIEYEDGSNENIYTSVSAWKSSNKTYDVNVIKNIKKVTLGNNRIADSDTENNIWEL